MPTEQDRTDFGAAIKNGDTQRITQFLQRADSKELLLMRSVEGNSLPIHGACYHLPSFETLELILDASVKHDIAKETLESCALGFNCVMLSFLSKSTKATLKSIRLLLLFCLKHADNIENILESTEREGNSVLHLAVSRTFPSVEALRMLISCFPSEASFRRTMSLKNKKNLTALDSTEAVEITTLLADPDCWKKCRTSWTSSNLSLSYATSNSYPWTTKSNGGNPFVVNQSQQPGLSNSQASFQLDTALSNANESALRLLLSQDSARELLLKRNEITGLLPIDIAALRHPSLVRAVLQAAENHGIAKIMLESKDPSTNTNCLLRAAGNRSVEFDSLLSLLIFSRKHADSFEMLCAKDSHGNTCLHVLAALVNEKPYTMLEGRDIDCIKVIICFMPSKEYFQSVLSLKNVDWQCAVDVSTSPKLNSFLLDGNCWWECRKWCFMNRRDVFMRDLFYPSAAATLEGLKELRQHFKNSGSWSTTTNRNSVFDDAIAQLEKTVTSNNTTWADTVSTSWSQTALPRFQLPSKGPTIGDRDGFLRALESDSEEREDKSFILQFLQRDDAKDLLLMRDGEGNMLVRRALQRSGLTAVALQHILDAARKNGVLEKVLEFKSGRSISNCLGAATRYSSKLNVLLVLLQTSLNLTDINKTLLSEDSDGNTALHQIAYRCDIEALKLLVSFYPSRESYLQALNKKNNRGFSVDDVFHGRDSQHQQLWRRRAPVSHHPALTDLWKHSREWVTSFFGSPVFLLSQQSSFAILNIPVDSVKIRRRELGLLLYNQTIREREALLRWYLERQDAKEILLTPSDLGLPIRELCLSSFSNSDNCMRMMKTLLDAAERLGIIKQMLEFKDCTNGVTCVYVAFVDHENRHFASGVHSNVNCNQLLLESCCKHSDVMKFLSERDRKGNTLLHHLQNNIENIVSATSMLQKPGNRLKMVIGFFPSHEVFQGALSVKNDEGRSVLDLIKNKSEVQSLQDPTCWRQCRAWIVYEYPLTTFQDATTAAQKTNDAAAATSPQSNGASIPTSGSPDVAVVGIPPFKCFKKKLVPQLGFEESIRALLSLRECPPHRPDLANRIPDDDECDELIQYLKNALRSLKSRPAIKKLIEENNLTDEDIMMLHSYKIEDPYPLYKWFNAWLMGNRRDEKIKNCVGPFFTLFHQALLKLPRVTKNANRAIRVNNIPSLKNIYDNYEEEWAVGKRLSFWGIASFSADPDFNNRPVFVGGPNEEAFIYSCGALEGVYIEDFKPDGLPAEDEILPLCPMVSEIAALVKFEKKVFVTIKQLPHEAYSYV